MSNGLGRVSRRHLQEEASIERPLQGERTMDDDEILHSYIPAAWWEQQLAKHPLKRQMLYWQLTQPQHEDITKRLIHALKILESVLDGSSGRVEEGGLRWEICRRRPSGRYGRGADRARLPVGTIERRSVCPEIPR